jgi:hypothetical protein
MPKKWLIYAVFLSIRRTNARRIAQVGYRTDKSVPTTKPAPHNLSPSKGAGKTRLCRRKAIQTNVGYQYVNDKRSARSLTYNCGILN